MQYIIKQWEYENPYDNDPTCGKGSRVHAVITDSEGNTVFDGITCPCGRGCGNKEDIYQWLS